MSEVPTGVIHDIGYRHYDGSRLGRGHAVRALFVYSLRAAFGLGRSAKAKVLPFLLFGVVCLPAVIDVAMNAVLDGVPLIPYAGYPYILQLVIAVFLAAQAPVLIAGDLRYHVLPLYFSRPILRGDYVGAKLGALAAAMLIVIATPQLILYLGALLTDHDALAETAGFLTALGGSIVSAVLLAALGLALACFTRRRAFGIVAIGAVYVMSEAVFGVLQVLTMDGAAQHYAGVVTPFALLDGFQAWTFGTAPLAQPGPPSGAGGAVYVLVTVAVLIGAAGVLLARYRRVEG